MSRILIPGHLKNTQQKNEETYDAALKRHIENFKLDVSKLAEREEIDEGEAMMFVMQSRLFNLLVNQEQLVWQLKKRNLI